MSAEGATIARRPANVRSKATNNPRRLAGVDGRKPEGRRRRDLLEQFVNALGGWNAVGEVQIMNAASAAELAALAEATRAKALQGGDVVLDDLVRIERLADRAVKRLNIRPKAQGDGEPDGVAALEAYARKAGLPPRCGGLGRTHQRAALAECGAIHVRPRFTMRQALEDPQLLGTILPGASWLAWRALLIAAMGEELTAEEREIFQRLTGREREPGHIEIEY